MTHQHEAQAPWISIHAFYAANANPLLVEAVGPLITRLREQGLLRRWFFIKYWLEGPHVRLRLRPNAAKDEPRVRAQAAAALEEFLRRRPALYESDRDGMGDLFKAMFLAEYGEQEWNVRYGADGTMPYRDNNSFHEVAYVPEFGRYGGPDGMELSEWHFEKSSDIVLRLIDTTNIHVRPVLLGQAAQIGMTLCWVFLRDEAKIVSFLEGYRDFWENSYQETTAEHHAVFDRNFIRMRGRLQQRLVGIRDGVASAGSTGITALEREWYDHCVELRAAAVRLAEAGRLTFSRGPVNDPDTALSILLTSYLHMASNRLGASILDEIYLAYVNRLAVLSIAEADGA
jgi:thiopeptide-type bacteriocin biosynthesis protein